MVSSPLSIVGSPSSAVIPSTVRVIFHERNKRNKSKGAALRTGFAAATEDVLVIQDADLEYDPRDWEEMWQLISGCRLWLSLLW